MNVDKNVPMPKGPGNKKYPFADMELGNSVFFPGARSGGREYLAAQAMARQKGWKFAGRAVTGGLRIWRVQ